MNKYIIILVFLCSGGLMAQSEIGNEEITITKGRIIELQKADRIYEKIPAVSNKRDSKAQTYNFYEKKPTGIEEVKFKANVISPHKINPNANENFANYNNYVNLGAGNYGRLYGEGVFNSDPALPLEYGVQLKHNSARLGPILDKLSSNNITEVGLNGNYHTGGLKLGAVANYSLNNYQFYGFDTTSNLTKDFVKEDIKQRLTTFNFGLLAENTNASSLIDYTIQTDFRTIKDYYSASEQDWGTTAKIYFPIAIDKVTAIVEGGYFFTQQTDNFDFAQDGSQSRNRTLFRVEPQFNLDFKSINIKAGLRIVNQYNQSEGINSTNLYPIFTASYKAPNMSYYFAGVDGNVLRNTLGSLLDENQFLKPQIDVINTEKPLEAFVGTRGDLEIGLGYNVKASYGKYTDLYFFKTVDSPTSEFIRRKFNVVYDNNTTNFFRLSSELNYQEINNLRSSLKADYYYYQTVSEEKAWHRPSFKANFENTYTVSNKLVTNLNCYFIGSRYGYNPIDQSSVKLKSIADVNIGLDYLFSPQFSAYFKLNNLLGNKYSTYIYYPNQGINFLAGLQVAL